MLNKDSVLDVNSVKVPVNIVRVSPFLNSEGYVHKGRHRLVPL